MANTATARSAVPVALKEGYGYAKVTPVVCTFDTTGSDLTVFTPTVSTNYAAIVGLVYQEASAHSLTITAGSTVLVTLEVPASGGLVKSSLCDGPLIVGGQGEALKIQCGTAAVSTMLVYCAEFKNQVLS